MALFARTAVFMFARRLMPGPHEFRIAVSAAAAPAARRAKTLARLGEIEKLLAGIRVEDHRSHRHLQDMSSPDRPWQSDPSPCPPRSA